MQKLSASHLQNKVSKSGIYNLLSLIIPYHDSNFRENTGVSFHSAPKLSANGPVIPQKYSQTDEDLNFRIKKFQSATLSKFLPYEHKM